VLCFQDCWQELTPRIRDLLEKLKIAKLIKKFFSFYVNRRFITAFTRARQLPILNQNVSVHASPFHFLKIHFNISLPSTPRPSNLFLSLRSPHQIPVRSSSVSGTCHMPYPSHSSWFVRPNSIWWIIQIIRLLVM